MSDAPLEDFPTDWTRGLAVAAHPDDLEYGAASAIARWTAEGRTIAYTLVTKGEAGIQGLPPDDCGPRRVEEELAGAKQVGVDTVEFLDHADGIVEYGLPLRRDLAAAIRRHRPEAIISVNFRDRWSPDAGPMNHVDHRVVGLALLDAARDAANRWTFPELLDEGLEPWDGARFVAFNASPQPTHAVDVTGYLDRGIASLAEHRAYLEGLGDGGTDPDAFLRGGAEAVGARQGVEHAVSFEIFPL